MGLDTISSPALEALSILALALGSGSGFGSLALASLALSNVQLSHFSLELEVTPLATLRIYLFLYWPLFASGFGFLRSYSQLSSFRPLHCLIILGFNNKSNNPFYL